MKELDMTKVLEEIDTQLNEANYDLDALIGRTLTKMMVMNIYLTNDILKAHGQDLAELGVSIITTRFKCSVIIFDKMSWIAIDTPICLYESLPDDIANILMIIQAAIDRIDM